MRQTSAAGQEGNAGFSPARRTLLRTAGALATLALVPVPFARAATDPAVAQAVAKVVAGRTPKEGGFTLDLPSLSENGAVVPLSVTVESPMTAADHVQAIHVFATKNPTPGIGTYRLSPLSGRAQVQTRIRLASDQTVIALVELSDGSVLRQTADVRVTVGGCAV